MYNNVKGRSPPSPESPLWNFLPHPTKNFTQRKKMALHPNITYLSSLIQLDSRMKSKKDGEDGGIRTHAVAH